MKRGAWQNEKLVASVAGAVRITHARRVAEAPTLYRLERGAIERALTRAEGNFSVAATTLIISGPALYRRMSKHGL